MDDTTVGNSPKTLISKIASTRRTRRSLNDSVAYLRQTVDKMWHPEEEKTPRTLIRNILDGDISSVATFAPPSQKRGKLTPKSPSPNVTNHSRSERTRTSSDAMDSFVLPRYRAGRRQVGKKKRRKPTRSAVEAFAAGVEAAIAAGENVSTSEAESDASVATSAVRQSLASVNALHDSYAADSFVLPPYNAGRRILRKKRRVPGPDDVRAFARAVSEMKDGEWTNESSTDSQSEPLSARNRKSPRRSIQDVPGSEKPSSLNVTAGQRLSQGADVEIETSQVRRRSPRFARNKTADESTMYSRPEPSPMRSKSPRRSLQDVPASEKLSSENVPTLKRLSQGANVEIETSQVRRRSSEPFPRRTKSPRRSSPSASGSDFLSSTKHLIPKKLSRNTNVDSETSQNKRHSMRSPRNKTADGSSADSRSEPPSRKPKSPGRSLRRVNDPSHNKSLDKSLIRNKTVQKAAMDSSEDENNFIQTGNLDLAGSRYTTNKTLPRTTVNQRDNHHSPISESFPAETTSRGFASPPKNLEMSSGKRPLRSANGQSLRFSEKILPGILKSPYGYENHDFSPKLSSTRMMQRRSLSFREEFSPQSAERANKHSRQSKTFQESVAVEDISPSRSSHSSPRVVTQSPHSRQSLSMHDPAEKSMTKNDSVVKDKSKVPKGLPSRFHNESHDKSLTRNKTAQKAAMDTNRFSSHSSEDENNFVQTGNLDPSRSSANQTLPRKTVNKGDNHPISESFSAEATPPMNLEMSSGKRPLRSADGHSLQLSENILQAVIESPYGYENHGFSPKLHSTRMTQRRSLSVSEEFSPQPASVANERSRQLKTFQKNAAEEDISPSRSYYSSPRVVTRSPHSRQSLSMHHPAEKSVTKNDSAVKNKSQVSNSSHKGSTISHENVNRTRETPTPASASKSQQNKSTTPGHALPSVSSTGLSQSFNDMFYVIPSSQTSVHSEQSGADENDVVEHPAVSSGSDHATRISRRLPSVHEQIEESVIKDNLSVYNKLSNSSLSIKKVTRDNALQEALSSKDSQRLSLQSSKRQSRSLQKTSLLADRNTPTPPAKTGLNKSNRKSLTQSRLVFSPNKSGKLRFSKPDISQGDDSGMDSSNGDAKEKRGRSMAKPSTSHRDVSDGEDDDPKISSVHRKRPAPTTPNIQSDSLGTQKRLKASPKTKKTSKSGQSARKVQFDEEFVPFTGTKANFEHFLQKRVVRPTAIEVQKQVNRFFQMTRNEMNKMLALKPAKSKYISPDEIKNLFIKQGLFKSLDHLEMNARQWLDSDGQEMVIDYQEAFQNVKYD